MRIYIRLDRVAYVGFKNSGCTWLQVVHYAPLQILVVGMGHGPSHDAGNGKRSRLQKKLVESVHLVGLTYPFRWVVQR